MQIQIQILYQKISQIEIQIHKKKSIWKYFSNIHRWSDQINRTRNAKCTPPVYSPIWHSPTEVDLEEELTEQLIETKVPEALPRRQRNERVDFDRLHGPLGHSGDDGKGVDNGRLRNARVHRDRVEEEGRRLARLARLLEQSQQELVEHGRLLSHQTRQVAAASLRFAAARGCC